MCADVHATFIHQNNAVGLLYCALLVVGMQSACILSWCRDISSESVLAFLRLYSEPCTCTTQPIWLLMSSTVWDLQNQCAGHTHRDISKIQKRRAHCADQPFWSKINIFQLHWTRTHWIRSLHCPMTRRYIQCKRDQPVINPLYVSVFFLMLIVAY